MNIKKYIPAVALSLPIIFYAFLVIYSRPYADDFCYMGSATSVGIFQLPINVFNSWSGRYTALFFIALTNGFSPLFGPFVLLLWGIVLAALFTKILRPRGVPRGTCWAMAVLFVVTTLAVAADPYETYYWTNSVPCYSLPLLFFALALYVL